MLIAHIYPAQRRFNYVFNMPESEFPTTAGIPPQTEDAGELPLLPSDALAPHTRLGEFELLRTLGVGGFGIVYLAFDHALERHVAIKEYLPSSLAGRDGGSRISLRSAANADTYAAGLRSFVNEAKLLAQFDHTSLVKVYRFWEANGTAYMVMPFYEGETLKTRRERLQRPADEAWLRSMLGPVMAALDELHAESVFHRDVSPDNILLLETGIPVLLDLGAARRVIHDKTHAPTAILKPSFAPIEQYASVSGLKQGPWTDLYSLGAVVYYCITGMPPAPSAARTVHDEHKPLAQLAPTIEREFGVSYSGSFLRAIDWALSVKPDDRPQSIDAMRAALNGRGERPAAYKVSAPVPALNVVAAAIHAEPVQSYEPTTPTPRMPATQEPAIGVNNIVEPAQGAVNSAPQPATAEPSVDLPVNDENSAVPTIPAQLRSDRAARTERAVRRVAPQASGRGKWLVGASALIAIIAVGMMFVPRGKPEGASVPQAAAKQPVAVAAQTTDNPQQSSPSGLGFGASREEIKEEAKDGVKDATPARRDTEASGDKPVADAPSDGASAAKVTAAAPVTAKTAPKSQPASKAAATKVASKNAQKPAAKEAREEPGVIESAVGSVFSTGKQDPAPVEGRSASGTQGSRVGAVAAAPKEACDRRYLVAYARCMKRECSKPQFANHAQCLELRRMERERSKRDEITG
jgi:serine/threonine protein kinase